MTKHLKALTLGAVLSVSGFAVSAAECIAPANPGGGWDFTCRQIGKILYDIGQVDAPVQVTNMAGGGGGLAFSHVVNERADDAELIVAASQATATRLAQNAYGGATADQVRFVGAIGADPGVIVVGADSPFMSLGDMVDAIKADPSAVAFAGGSAAGGFDHLKVLQVLKASGFDDITSVKYIGVDGGADAITQTVGGFTQAMTGDMSEVVGFIESGEVRVLAVLTEERVPGFDDIPTAMEQGFDVVAVNWRGLYVPKNISDADFQKWATSWQAVAESDEWQQAMADNGLAPFTKVGGDFQSWIDGVIASDRGPEPRNRRDPVRCASFRPHLRSAVVVLVALAYIASALQIQTSSSIRPVGPRKPSRSWWARLAALCGAVMIFATRRRARMARGARAVSLAIAISVTVLVGYAYALKPLGFLIPTAVAAGVISYQITPRPRAAVFTGILISIGLYLLFRYVLGLSLFGLPRWLTGWSEGTMPMQDVLANLSLGFSIALSPYTLMLAVLGCFIGTIVGALPGLGPSNGVAIMIPLTFQHGARCGGRLGPADIDLLRRDVWRADQFDLLNIPGDEPAMMTCLDGYPWPRTGALGTRW
jgi:putative tricarboxylic transport membrane protein